MAGTTPSIQEQRAFIKANFEGVTVQEGETWYPLNAEWWNSLLMHVQWQTQSGGEEGEEGEGKDEAPSPGAIDNAALADAVTPLALKAGLEEGKVFVWVKEPLWKQLVAWYGGGPAFPRSTTVLEGAYLASIDMYPQPCKCFTAGVDGEPVVGSAVTFLSNRKVNFAQTAKAVHGALKSTATPGTWRVWVRETVEDKWELVPGAGQEGSATALEVVAKNHPFTQFLLETKVGGAYKRSVESAAAEGASSAPADTPEWRAGLQEGSWLDAQDSEDKWYAARIFAVVEEGQDEKLTAKGTALAGKPGRKFHVQFETWSIAYAEWFAESSTKLAPLRTHSKAWRDALRPLSLVEHSLPDAKGELRWYLLKIRTVNRAANPPILTLVAESDITRKVLPESTEVPLDAMTLAPAYTHTKKPVAVAATNNARRGYQLANVGRGGGSFGRWARHRAGRAHEAGAVGLDNLGNTCFMNSMLQCLTASQPLTEHFLSGAWESEVNVDNVLGQGGRIAAAYASLMEAMWSGQYAVCSPGEVKGEVGKAAPQFQGFQQHDSQELMSFLLDGIHEDLNRVLKKPYVEDVSSMGRPDPVVALEAWKRYKLRNDSVVVDTFTGQFRSHLTCNVCGEQSVTFDPFTSVSVPVSEFESKKTLVCTFAPGNPAWHAVRYRSFVPKHGVLGDIVDWIATEAVFPIAEDLEESKEAEEVKEGEEGAPPTEAAPAAAAGGTGGSAPPTPALEAADMMCVKVNFRSHCIASFCGRQDSVGDIQGNDWMYIYQVPKPTDPAHVALEKGWAAKAERAIAARAAARAGKAVETEEGESEEELLAFTYIENRPYVVELRMRQPQARATYMAAAGTKVGYGVPELVSIPNVTGSVDEAVLPTGKALYADVWGRMAKYIKPEAQEKYSPENPPFALSVAPVPNRRAPGTLGALVPVEYTDEGVAIDRYEEVLVVDWSPEAAADRVDAGSGDMARQEKTSYGDRVDKDDETSIKSCFKRFVSKEQLGSNDKWYCPHCKEHVQAYKQMSLYSLPDVLVVHLKRFHVTNYGRQMTSFLSRSKLDNYVGYPLEGLDVSEFVSGPQTGPHLYDCFAVSDHMGGMGGGHYVAYSKNFRSGKWYSCNDSSVSPASPDSIVSRRNYVLFFRKRTPSGMKSAAHLVAAAAAAEAAAPSAPAGAAE